MDQWLVLLKTVEKLQAGLINDLSNHKLFTEACYIASTRQANKVGFFFFSCINTV
jgi:hypothetical protein